MKTISNSEWFDSLFQQTIGNYDIIYSGIANITTANITTANITTGNIDTLFVNHVRLLTPGNSYISVEDQLVVTRQVAGGGNFGVLNSNIIAGDTNTITVGKSNTNGNAAEFAYQHVGDSSPYNKLILKHWGGGNQIMIPYSTGELVEFNSSIKSVARSESWFLPSNEHMGNGPVFGYVLHTWNNYKTSGLYLLTESAGGIWQNLTGTLGASALMIRHQDAGQFVTAKQQVTGDDSMATSCIMFLDIGEGFTIVVDSSSGVDIQMKGGLANDVLYTPTRMMYSILN